MSTVKEWLFIAPEHQIAKLVDFLEVQIGLLPCVPATKARLLLCSTCWHHPALIANCNHGPSLPHSSAHLRRHSWYMAVPEGVCTAQIRVITDESCAPELRMRQLEAIAGVQANAISGWMKQQV